MDWQTEVKLLGMKKTRRDAMKQLLDAAAGRLKAAQDAGDKTGAFREELYINRMTVDITKLNDEIFSLGQKLGIDPEGGLAEFDSTNPVSQSGTAASSN